MNPTTASIPPTTPAVYSRKNPYLAELIGHEQGFTLSVYAPMQLPVKALRELVERVRYPGLRLDHLHV